MGFVEQKDAHFVDNKNLECEDFGPFSVCIPIDFRFLG